MSKYLIGLDDGHGMETEGKRTPSLKTDLMFRGKLRKKGTIIHENDFNENIMELIEKGLDRCGIGHIQLAEGDTDIPLQDRVKKANNKKCGLVVSCHANALEGDKWQDKAYGLVVIHTKNCSSTSKKLAKNCYNHLKDVDWYKNGGTKYGIRADTDVSGFTLYILRRTSMPAILIEYGFMDHWEDVKIMVTEEFQKSCAEATVKGICETLGVKYIEEKKQYIRVLKDVNLHSAANFKESSICGKVIQGTVLTVIKKIKRSGTDMYLTKAGTYITSSQKYIEIFTK